MKIENMPFCCTSAVLGSFGEHGEPSVVTVDEIHRLLNQEIEVMDLGGEIRGGHKRYVLATTIDPENLRILRNAGFREIDKYKGIQGMVHVMAFHAPRGGE